MERPKLILRVLPFLVVYAIVLSVALGHRGFRGGGAARAAATPAPNPRKILVVGATGGTGRRLVEQALARGLEVTAFVREPSRLGVEHANLHIARGDVLDLPSVEAAVRGKGAVVVALGHKRWFGPSRILSDGTANILHAMEAHGVRRLVCETALGIGDSAGRLGLLYTLFVIPVILPFYFWDKTRQERLVASSKLDWVLVRPAALTNRARRGSVRHGAGVGSFVFSRSIPRADVAEFMLDQLVDDANLGTAVGVC